MCGGQLETIPCSHVGHIFRSRSPYSWHVNQSNPLRHNLLRLAEALLGDYKYFYFARVNFQTVANQLFPLFSFALCLAAAAVLPTPCIPSFRRSSSLPPAPKPAVFIIDYLLPGQSAVRCVRCCFAFRQPGYHCRVAGCSDMGDVSDRKAILKKLKCKSFKWYLDNIYPEMFIPSESTASGEVREANCDDFLLAIRFFFISLCFIF
ncbi:unnamed protein product [Schistocephalus solidus]|uniref:Uncharacterized protein n=1 Tax=Schistocephalus solidus TaxID=70667 RepID=A0A183T879_SCHSO|nr:unnamed protein product [Schistocephalus solidus]